MTTTPEPANEGIYIPTELLWMILSHVQELPNPQETLASCSLVCRQWCSAATFLLYQKPKILPKNFHAFAEAITSPNLPRARKGDLGQYVRRLDLSDLVHHSTKSLTARLLRDVREGLEVFIAPVHTVSSSNLISVSKCRKLRILDLSLVLEVMSFDEIKHAIRNLTNLKTLRLPKRTSLTLSANNIAWPPNLTTFQFGGNVPRETPSCSKEFSWPEKLTSLTFHVGKYSTVAAILIVLGNSHVKQNLRRLRITSQCETSSVNIMLDISRYIPKVKFLSLPASDATSIVITEMQIPENPLELEILELAPSKEAPALPISSLERALPSLPKLRRIGIHEMHVSLLNMDGCGEKLDRILRANAFNAGYDKEQLESGEIPTGYYIFS